MVDKSETTSASLQVLGMPQCYIVIFPGKWLLEIIVDSIYASVDIDTEVQQSIDKGYDISERTSSYMSVFSTMPSADPGKKNNIGHYIPYSFII